MEFEETLKDELAGFFSEPTKEKFAEIVDADKEYDYIECKGEWIKKGKLAKHILAFANSGGGTIIIGVEESEGSLTPVGFENLRDESKFGEKIEKYIPDRLNGDIMLQNYEYSENIYPGLADKKFQVIFVETDEEEIPYVSTGSTSGINKDQIYVRKNTRSETASHSDIQDILKRRIEASANESSLEQDLDDLETLYDRLDNRFNFTSSMTFAFDEYLSRKKTSTAVYPDKTFAEIVMEMIAKKKFKIDTDIGVENMEVVDE